jgi:hypothetical protein
MIVAYSDTARIPTYGAQQCGGPCGVVREHTGEKSSEILHVAEAFRRSDGGLR